MTTAEKLEALVRRAIENGADLKLTPLSVPDYVKLLLGGSPWVEQLLFGSHDFARALFKHPDHGVAEENCVQHPGWQWHLQQAVISNDPISYYYEAIFGERNASS